MLRKCLALAAFACALFAPSTSAQTCAPFTDVLASSGFCGNIQWLYNRGVTLGCTPTTYCPTQFVRRDQMAAFLNRLADNLFPLTCAAGQVMKWNGTTWACAADNPGVTSITAGTGLTGGTITTTGTVAADTAYLQRRVSTSCAPGSSIRAIAADGSVTCETDDGAGNAFVQGGNAFGTTAVLGANDSQSLDIRVNGSRVMRYEPSGIPNVIGGSSANSVTASTSLGATIAGGGAPQNPNRVSGTWGTVGGGLGNVAGSDAGSPNATVGGGFDNTASGGYSTIAGGYSNTASDFATVAGGIDNAASGNTSTVAGGGNNTASGGLSTVAGGSHNTASGDFSFAAGLRAKATRPGQFVWADAASNFDFDPDAYPLGWSDAINTFTARATGGVWFVTGIDAASGVPTTGCSIQPNGGAWGCASSRETKTDFEPVDGRDVLQKVVALPIQKWRFNGQPATVRHMGPMAQDFRAAFGLGYNDTTIVGVDTDGVALAAIQGLNEKVEAQAREIAVLRQAVADLLARSRSDATAVQ